MISSTDKDIYTVLKSQDLILGSATQSYLIPSYPLPHRKKLCIYNNGSVALYIGGSDVTISNGYPLGIGDHFIINAPNNVYAVSSASGHTIRILEVE